MGDGYPLGEMNFYYEWYYTPPTYCPYPSPNYYPLWFGIGLGAGVGIGVFGFYLIKRRKQ